MKAARLICTDPSLARLDPQNLSRVTFKSFNSYTLTLTMSNPSNPKPPARGSGLSLYANLLDPTGDATVSKGPVVFKPAETPDEAISKKPQIDPGIFTFNSTYLIKIAHFICSCFTIPTHKETTTVAKAKAQSLIPKSRTFRCLQPDQYPSRSINIFCQNNDQNLSSRLDRARR